MWISYGNMTTVPGSSISQSSSALEPDEYMHILCSFCVHSDVYIMNLFTFTLSAVCDEAVGLTGATWCNTWHVATRGISPAFAGTLGVFQCLQHGFATSKSASECHRSHVLVLCILHNHTHVIAMLYTMSYDSIWLLCTGTIDPQFISIHHIRRNSTSSMVRRAGPGSPWVLSRSVESSVVSGSPWLSKISDLVPLWRACAATSLCLAERRHHGVATRVASMSLPWWNHHLFKWFWDWYGLILVEMSRERRIDPTGSVEGGNGKAS